MIIKPKGMYDIYGNDAKIYTEIRSIIDHYMKLYNISYVSTPIVEHSELFHRSVGESSDIVSKETYDFKDRGDRSLTLRPEGTASVARLLIENKLYGNRNDVMKYYYFGSMYRYERPQSGRNREFTQFGVEYYNANTTKSVAESIAVGYNFYHLLGLEDVIVKINSLGDKESKDNYSKALKEYFKPHLKELCPDCNRRYKTNPLRILDCKYDKDSDILKNAPKISDYLNKSSKEELKELTNLLTILEIDYEIDTKIVRGLDYYTGVVYEYMIDENVVGAGGSYDNLSENLGGPSLKATGFALGIDRIILELKKNKEETKEDLDVFIISVSEEEKYQSLKLSQELRLNGIKVENSFNDISLKSQFKLTDSYNTKFIIILNDEDLKQGLIAIKDTATKESEKVDVNEVIDYLFTNL